MSCHLQKGRKNRVAFVFSCPGRHEEADNRPAAKTTGKNLDKLLKKLSERLNQSDLLRENITITNSWNKVEYKLLTHRTEATDKEIFSQGNISRLNDELRNITHFVVCCGDKATSVIDKCTLKNNVKVLSTVHLGTRGLNKISNDLYGQKIINAESQMVSGDMRSKKVIQENNTSRRLDRICDDLVRQLKSC